jgi:hypothetical protein
MPIPATTPQPTTDLPKGVKPIPVNLINARIIPIMKRAVSFLVPLSVLLLLDFFYLTKKKSSLI